jgi:hypothetical protein
MHTTFYINITNYSTNIFLFYVRIYVNLHPQ